MSVARMPVPKIDYQAYFDIPVPDRTDLLYMHNVLLTFVSAIPQYCYRYCTSAKHPRFTGLLQGDELQAYLRDYVEERLGQLADYEYREWMNGRQPFITPRELQIWRLRQFVQYIWFWNLPDENALAMIFNLTKRRAQALGTDFIARFRKTIVYPVALRRLYHLINTAKPSMPALQAHPRTPAEGYVYRVPARRFVEAAQSLAEDLRAEIPDMPITPPYLWDEDFNEMWVDKTMVDIMTTNEKVRKRLYDVYPLPT
ncbi:MAG TPA: hypothetical protein VF266_03135 [Thermoanaerobaculia bacterium]